MTRVVLVLALLIVSSSLRTDESSFREQCWKHYMALKLCTPQYDSCLTSMGHDCDLVLEICISEYKTTEDRSTCEEYLQKFIESRRKNETNYSMELFERHTFKDSIMKNKKEECNVSIFENHHIFLSNVSPYSRRILKDLPNLILKYCQCPVQNSGNITIEIFARSRKSSIPIQFYYGGLKNVKCWKEVDRLLAETLCGETSTFLINHEWAKQADCLENPASNNCTSVFTEGLQRVSKKSEKPLFCLVYVEIVTKSIEFFNSTSSDNIRFRDDELYLINQTNRDLSLECFPVKRILNAYNYTFNHCKRHSEIKCEEEFVEYLKTDKGITEKCASVVFPRENSSGFPKQLVYFLWSHKWTCFIFCIVGAIITCSKSIRNWLVKKLAIKTFTYLAKQLDAATKYFNNLLPAVVATQEEPSQIESSISQTQTDEPQDENNQSVDQNASPLLPVDYQCSTSSLTSTYENQNGNQEEENQQNNQDASNTLINSASIENLKKEKTEEPKKEKATFSSSATNFLRSFGNMICSLARVTWTFGISPAYIRFRQFAFPTERSSTATMNSDGNNGNPSQTVILIQSEN
ncbi:hypothetical protein B9Z55_019561 [Caenorhabditis nigoni]|uniref:Uncharacterized protein n=1 Tax=Caenorhabditis nigoni TaxID=1611254 RepID=A0A2G5TIW4_9PELO|nr:hypothetical protein B9Z55_019561 [Caenorhabditis nigoni]